jgi:integrase
MGQIILKSKTRMKSDQPLELLLSSLKSIDGRKTYKANYQKFLDFSGMKNGQQIIDTTPKKLTQIIIDYVLDLAEKISPNAIPTYLACIQSFCDINDVDLKWKKIRKFYPAKVKNSGQNAYSTEHVRKMLSITRKLQHRALIHFYSSTGARVGCIHYQFDAKSKRPLTIGDLRDMPHDCQQVTIYRDTKEEYITFLTPEAVIEIQNYLTQRRNLGEIITNDSPLFIRDNGTPVREFDVSPIMQNILGISDVRGQKKNGRYPVQALHGFRKRFNTILKLNNTVNDNAIEKMMGHTRGLDGTYLQITNDRLFEEFWKGVSDLTIDSTSRDQIKIKELESQAVPDEQEIINKIMPSIMGNVRKQLGLDKITPEIVDNLDNTQLKNLVKNFLTN